jgi:hypothetical protein
MIAMYMLRNSACQVLMEKEAVMSSIQGNPAAVRGLLGVRRESGPTQSQPTRKPSKDAALMYAWSIGTTRAASAPSEKTSKPAREDCPPEVYIG